MKTPDSNVLILNLISHYFTDFCATSRTAVRTSTIASFRYSGIRKRHHFATSACEIAQLPMRACAYCCGTSSTPCRCGTATKLRQPHGTFWPKTAGSCVRLNWVDLLTCWSTANRTRRRRSTFSWFCLNCNSWFWMVSYCNRRSNSGKYHQLA